MSGKEKDGMDRDTNLSLEQENLGKKREKQQIGTHYIVSQETIKNESLRISPRIK